MNLTDNINSAEKGCKAHLESYFLTNYPVDKLISHGIDHHRRVWEYAKELLQYIENIEYTSAQLFVQKLLIACYMHDIGMAVDTGVKHGCHSRDTCLRFIREHNLKETYYLDVLSAIENHDNKDYGESGGENELQTILSVADDLDAFGYIGIYRFAEISLLRGISPSDLGQIILVNATNRFRNFNKSYSSYPDLVLKHRKRFEILAGFFNNYNRIKAGYIFGSNNPSGYCGVIEIINESVKGNKVLNLSIIRSEISVTDTVIHHFFTELQSELSGNYP